MIVAKQVRKPSAPRNGISRLNEKRLKQVMQLVRHDKNKVTGLDVFDALGLKWLFLIRVVYVDAMTHRETTKVFQHQLVRSWRAIRTSGCFRSRSQKRKPGHTNTGRLSIVTGCWT